jgi:hypothetical protein
VLVLVGLIKLAAAVDFFAGARFGVAFFADDVLFAGAATDAAAFAFGVSFFALVEVLVAAAPTFFVEEDGFASWNSCPAQPNTKAMTTTVAAIPKGCVKSPINVSGFADALDIFAFVFCRISFCWCVFWGGERKNWKNQRENWKRRAHTARVGERARARARRARDVEKGKNMPDAKKAASFPRAMTRARDITSEPLM